MPYSLRSKHGDVWVPQKKKQKFQSKRSLNDRKKFASIIEKNYKDQQVEENDKNSIRECLSCQIEFCNLSEAREHFFINHTIETTKNSLRNDFSYNSETKNKSIRDDFLIPLISLTVPFLDSEIQKFKSTIEQTSHLKEKEIINDSLEISKQKMFEECSKKDIESLNDSDVLIKTYVCPECSFTCVEVEQFHDHYFEHSIKFFHCSNCQYSSNSVWEVTDHIKMELQNDLLHFYAEPILIHKDIKEYSKYDKFTLPINSLDMISEKSSHKNDLIFRPKINKNVIIHRDLRFEGSMIVCCVCGFRSYEEKIIAHMIDHLHIMPYGCKSCEYETNFYDIMLKHLNDAHSELSQPDFDVRFLCIIDADGGCRVLSNDEIDAYGRGIIHNDDGNDNDDYDNFNVSNDECDKEEFSNDNGCDEINFDEINNEETKIKEQIDGKN